MALYKCVIIIIIITVSKNLGGPGKIWGPVPPWPQRRTAPLFGGRGRKDRERAREGKGKGKGEEKERGKGGGS